MSRAASLPGAELVSQKSDFFLTSHLSWAASLPGAELSLKILRFFEQATCPGQLRCLGQNCFSKNGLLFEQATCPGQLRCPGQNFFSEIRLFEQPTCPRQLRCLGQKCFSEVRLVFSNKPLVPSSFAAWCRAFSQKTDCQEIWDSCAQNKTSEISKDGLSLILGLLCAEQDVGNLKKCTFTNSGTSVRRTRLRKS